MAARTVVLGGAMAILAAAGPPPASPPPPGASSCSGCHGGAAPLPAIAGQPRATLAAALDAFRSGERHGTVMNRLAKGFTKAESDAIAAWWSGQGQ